MQLLKLSSNIKCPAFEAGCCNFGSTCRLGHWGDGVCPHCGSKGCGPQKHRDYKPQSGYIKFHKGQEAKKCEVIKSGYTGPEAYPKKSQKPASACRVGR